MRQRYTPVEMFLLLVDGYAGLDNRNTPPERLSEEGRKALEKIRDSSEERMEKIGAAVKKMIASLKERERTYLILVCGLDGGGPCSLGEAGKKCGVTGARVRQVLYHALRHCRQPGRHRILRQALGEESEYLVVPESSIDEVDWTTRTRNCLNNWNINTFADLIGYTEKDLFRMRNFGKKGMGEVKKILSSFGWSLKK